MPQRELDLLRDDVVQRPALLFSPEVRSKPLRQRGAVACLQDLLVLVSMERLIGDAPGVNRLQSRHQVRCSDGARREAIRRELLVPGDPASHAQKHHSVPLEGFADEATLGEPDDRAADGGAKRVDPRTEAGVTRVKMTELVGQHRLELRHREQRQERQPETHDGAIEQPQHSAAPGHERVHSRNEVHLAGHLSPRGSRDLPNHGEKLGVLLW